MQCGRCHRYYPEGYRFCPYDGTETVERVPSSSLRSRPTKFGDVVLAGRWRVRGFVGKGAMARVYLAEDERTGGPVAIKVLEEPFRRDVTVRERFQREAQAASLIGHPCIVQVFATGEREDDGAPYIVMEYLVGESWGDYLRRERTMPRQLALEALEQAASALAAAHRAGIIHRDVKPDNIIVAADGRARLVDFGLSKMPSSSLTAAGMILGTPATMAPEQALGEEVDARTDVYALGMVAYRALSGRSAFDDDSDEIATLAHHGWTSPVPLAKVAPDVDEALDHVVMKAIRKRPEERFQTMDAFAEALGRLARPDARMSGPLPPEEPYPPSSLVGTLVKASLGRAIGRDEEDPKDESGSESD